MLVFYKPVDKENIMDNKVTVRPHLLWPTGCGKMKQKRLLKD
jgi:hypothetical protein